MTSDHTRLLVLVTRLRDSDRSRSAARQLGPSGWANRCDATLILVRSGEQRLALEDLCSNLIEFDVPLTPDEHADLASLASQSDLPRSAWAGLADLIDLNA